jgi:hypothetical protein
VNQPIQDAREKDCAHALPNHGPKHIEIIMSSNDRFARFIPVLAGPVMMLAIWCRAGDEHLVASASARTGSPVNGSATIDVSEYPAGIRANYKIFSQKCSQCHSLGRPINSKYVLPNEWSHCIRRMKHRTGANIDSSAEEKLYDFLIYDSSVRKRNQLEAKLQTLTPDAQKEAANKIKKVTDKYR